MQGDVIAPLPDPRLAAKGATESRKAVEDCRLVWLAGTSRALGVIPAWAGLNLRANPHLSPNLGVGPGLTCKAKSLGTGPMKKTAGLMVRTALLTSRAHAIELRGRLAFPGPTVEAGLTAYVLSLAGRRRRTHGQHHCCPERDQSFMSTLAPPQSRRSVAWRLLAPVCEVD